MDKLTRSVAPTFRRRRGLFEGLIEEMDVALGVLSGHAQASRAYPAQNCDKHADDALQEAHKRHAAGLMRVNHVGEVCAQALYRGQALGCRHPQTITLLHHAAQEETDHLAWCQQRLVELNSRTSYLNPIWYVGSFTLGLAASQLGVARNLGFMAETERQVEAHLESHLRDLPTQDLKSRAIVTQMRDDEIEHRKTAQKNGAVALPKPFVTLMTLMSKVMTKTAYQI